MSTFTVTAGTATYYNGNSAAADIVASSPFASEGTYSLGKSNATLGITTGNINTSAYNNIQLSFRVAAFSIGAGNGLDGDDYIRVEISPNGGTTYYSTLEVRGFTTTTNTNNNAAWSYAGATGVGTTPYDGDATAVIRAPTGGGTRTFDAIGTAIVTSLPASANMRVRITIVNNSAGERWVIDDFKLTGYAVLNPATLTATTASTTQINLAATANVSNNDIVVVANNSGVFTAPADGTAPGAVGSSFAGGTIVYKGPASGLTNHTGLASGTTYYYKAFSVNATNQYSTGITANAATISNPPIAEPATLILQNGFSANWAAPLNNGTAFTYTLEVSTSNTFGTLVANVTGLTTTTFTNSVTGLTAGTIYYYRIKAVNAAGNSSAYSNTIQVTTLNAATAAAAPTAQASALTATAISTSQINLNWTGATFPAAPQKGYIILSRRDRAAPNALGISNGVAPLSLNLQTGTTIAGIINGTGTTFSHTGLLSASPYSYTLIPFTWDGANSASYTYLTSGTLATATATTLSTATVATASHSTLISTGTSCSGPIGIATFDYNSTSQSLVLSGSVCTPSFSPAFTVLNAAIGFNSADHNLYYTYYDGINSLIWKWPAGSACPTGSVAPFITLANTKIGGIVFDRAGNGYMINYIGSSAPYGTQLQKLNVATGTLDPNPKMIDGVAGSSAFNSDFVITPGGQFLMIQNNQYFSVNYLDYGTSTPLKATLVRSYGASLNGDLGPGFGSQIIALAYSQGKLIGGRSATCGASPANNFNYTSDIVTGNIVPIPQTQTDQFRMADLTSVSSSIGSSKRLAFANPVSATVYDLAYEIKVKNLGDWDITSLQLTDDLKLIHPSGASAISNVSVQVVSNPAGIALNPAYNGTTNINLIAASQTLPNFPVANDSLVVRVLFRLTGVVPGTIYYNNATATGQGFGAVNLMDVSTDGSVPDLDLNGNADDAGEAQPTPFMVPLTSNFLPCSTFSTLLYNQAFGTTATATIPTVGGVAPVTQYTGSTTFPLGLDNFTVIGNPNTANGTYWNNLADHTTATGSMLVVNAGANSNVVYSFTVNGLTAGTQYSLSLFVANISNAAQSSSCSSLGGFTNPRLIFRVKDQATGVVLTSLSSGDIISSAWKEYGIGFTQPAGYPNILIEIVNDGQGGCGNDLAIDDIKFGVPTPGACDLDDDNDGIPNSVEGAGDADGDGIINQLDLDSDNDGIPDVVEAGGVDANGDGRIDNYADVDGDGLSDNVDANLSGATGSGNGLGIVDTDGDGIPNYLDLDSDNDGIPDVIEAGGTDANNDGKIDGYTDTDNDGFSDNVDGDVGNDGVAENFANALLRTGADTNADGRANSYPFKNMDNDSKANPYDLDSDGDGITDVREAGFADVDYDGRVDGVVNANGWNTAVAALGALNLPNTDGIGKANVYDIDSDEDGIPDNIEGQLTSLYKLPSGLDTDGDGIDNTYDNAPAAFGGDGIHVVDTDGDTVPDYRDLDTDNDGLSDRIEGNDLNLNGLPDDNVTLTGLDTDGDGLDDRFDNDNTSSKVTSRYMGTNGSTTGDSSPGSITTVQHSANSTLAGCGTERDWRCMGFVLSIKVITFKAVEYDQSVALDWTVVSQKKLDYFIVQRSTDGITFSDIIRVAGKSAWSEIDSYHTTDDIRDLSSDIIYYRLRSVLQSGESSISNIIAIRVDERKIISITVSPNPVKDLLQVSLNASSLSTARLFIVDGSGRTIKKYTENVFPGINKFNYVEPAHLPGGIYYLKVDLGDRIITRKFSIVK